MAYEHKLRHQYTDINTRLTLAFPGIEPPESRWIILWLQKYPFSDIVNSIDTLAAHPLKAKFTQDSVGRALTSLLKEAAVRRLTASLSGGAK